MSNGSYHPTIFFTGGTSGLGKEAACALANKGAKVVVTVRNEKKGQQLLSYFNDNFNKPKGSIELLTCELNSFGSIQNAINEFKTSYKKLDILINNAGAWKEKFEKTVDGIEETFQVNVLAPYILLKEFADLLSVSTDARIINTASGLHQGEIKWNDIEYNNDFKGFNVYRQSKLALILINQLFAQKLKEKNIGVYSLHPGVVRTELARESKWLMRNIFLLMGISAKKGAKTLIYLATENKRKLLSGKYYYKNKVSETTPYSNNMEYAKRLEKTIEEYLADF